MVSHKKISGMEITLGAGGLRFKKRPSGFNMCIGNALEGGRGPTEGGRYDKKWQSEFTAAVKKCAGKVGKVV